MTCSSPILPMLARRVQAIPEAGDWIFEPKWDGFRAIVFRTAREVLLQSRDEKTLNRYFPEILPAVMDQLPPDCVLDGELVIAREGRLDFEALQLRIHPAASRVKMLAAETPASIVFFDLLCDGNQDLRRLPFAERRSRLERLLKKAKPPLHLTPATRDRALAENWFRRFEGAGLDGVVAKSVRDTYQPDKRVMLKIKHERDCDCVVAGFRWYRESEGREVGSLLLGLYDDAGVLQHVGVCASFSAAQRKELVTFLEPFRRNALRNHPWKNWAEEGSTPDQRMPGARSRWSRGKDLAWQPLRIELVAEVAYEHLQGRRFRHMAHFRRWRRDRTPASCTFAQLDVASPQELADLFSRRRAA